MIIFQNVDTKVQHSTWSSGKITGHEDRKKRIATDYTNLRRFYSCLMFCLCVFVTHKR